MISTAPTVTIHGKRFHRFIPAAEISALVEILGRRIAADYTEPPLLVCVLKGSIIFTADLIRAIGSPAQLDFIKVTSYDGMASTGTVSYQLELATDIRDRHVIVVEDIVDTGRTLGRVMTDLAKHRPASLAIATLLHKPTATKVPLELRYVGKAIPDDFVIGYGLDFDEQGRELPDIFVLDEEQV
jgi:hypoxanthine phosphoribosyltransferase